LIISELLFVVNLQNLDDFDRGERKQHTATVGEGILADNKRFQNQIVRELENH